jgi:hypothetical protein
MLWSLWAELGAGGWERRHQSIAIDVEPLIIATTHPSFQRLDRRLVEQALEWSISNVRLVSAVRLRNLLPEFSAQIVPTFSAFAAVVNHETHAYWPSATKALSRMRPRFERSRSEQRHSPVADLTRPSLLQLRLRACWGVSVRAEIIRLLLADSHLFLGVSQLAVGAAFGRHNVADAVENMVRAGILRERGAGGWRQFQLAKRDLEQEQDQDPWALLFGPLPKLSPDWIGRLKLVLALMEFAEADVAPPLRRTEIARLLREHADDIARNGIVFALPQPGPTSKEPVEAFEDQSANVLLRWSGSENVPTASATRKAHVR